MDRDIELTSFLLRYLRKNGYFHSIRAMALEFDMSKRTLQLQMNSPEKCKGGTLALSKVLLYFGEHHIPLDCVLAEFLDTNDPTNLESQIPLNPEAYQRLRLPMPVYLKQDEKKRFDYYHSFLCLLSQYICPACRNWCEPWNGRSNLTDQQCVLGRVAQKIVGKLGEKDVTPDDPR